MSYVQDNDDMDCDDNPVKRFRAKSPEEVTEPNTSSANMFNVPNIPWPMLYPKPTANDEMEMEKYLVLSRHESGRGIELPVERQQIIEQQAYNRGFLLTGALSLRRQLIRKVCKGSGSFFNSRNMGDNEQAKIHASNFELATESYIRQQLERLRLDSSDLMTEADLKALNLPLTPDFVFRDDNIQINGVTVKWIDCKTYYGASSLVNLTYLPIGKLRQQCEKYMNAFGPGAVVFLNGFSQDLNEQIGLNPQDVLFLDANPIDTSDFNSITGHTDMQHKEEMHCPKHLMGVVIGKGGSNITRLQESSGCNIVLHQEFRKVVITASSEVQLQVGVSMVQPLLLPPATQARQYLCPLRKACLVIGKKGATVRQLMEQSGCVIKTNRADVSADGRSQIVYITGRTVEAVEMALALIQQIVERK